MRFVLKYFQLTHKYNNHSGINLDDDNDNCVRISRLVALNSPFRDVSNGMYGNPFANLFISLPLCFVLLCSVFIFYSEILFCCCCKYAVCTGCGDGISQHPLFVSLSIKKHRV